MLLKALDGVISQFTGNKFSFEVVVVDNDKNRSAENIVSIFKKRKGLNIVYDCEPEKNIALARNRTIYNAKANFIAFIDDDEFPCNKWLYHLYLALISSKADGVLGPVIPHFEKQPPKWLLKSKLLERPSFSTGTLLKSGDTRTGNLLFNRRILENESCPFDPRFGKTGGEDGDFFRRMIKKGHIFIWCNEAYVYETVPSDRLKKSYFLKRAYIRGVSEAKLSSFLKIGIFRSLIAVSLYASILPVLFIIGQHLFMRYLVKICDHTSKLLALCGIELIKERNF